MPQAVHHDSDTVDVPTDGPLLHYSPDEPPATRCEMCQGRGTIEDTKRKRYRKSNGHELGEELPCRACHAIGWFGINPYARTLARPGSAAKTAVLAARYRAIEDFGHRNSAGSCMTPGDTGIEPFNPLDWIEPEESHITRADRKGFYQARAA
jgi:hypothetical protein